MSPAISMSALEILPSLLDKSKTQTIRPLNPIYKPVITSIDLIRGNEYEVVQDWRKPRFKVGDKVKIYWKMRSKAKWFCNLNTNCGGEMMYEGEESGCKAENGIQICSDGWVRWQCKKCHYSFSCDPNHIKENIHLGMFPKLLGTVEITELFEIEMHKEGDVYHVDYRLIPKGFQFGKDILSLQTPNNVSEIPERDGFKSAADFFEYFNQNYDLSQPRRFCVYRWKWL